MRRFVAPLVMLALVAVLSPSPAQAQRWWRREDPAFDLAKAPKIPPGLNREYALETTPSRKVTATFTETTHAPRLKAATWTIFSGLPPEGPSQHILGATMSPPAENVEELGRDHRHVLRARLKVADKEHETDLKCAVTVEAELFARRLVSRSKVQSFTPCPDLSDAERLAALRPTVRNNYDAEELQKWAEARHLTRADGEGEIDFARRVFKEITQNFTYEYVNRMNRTASRVCLAGKSDCGGLSALFITILRWQGVPARQLVGRWASSMTQGEKLGEINYTQEHVKAEFFAQEVGWVPVDLSSAITGDKTPERLEYFGRDGGDFITMHYDSGLVVDTVELGQRRIEWLQGVATWAAGGGDFTDSKREVDWKVKRLRLKEKNQETH